MKREPKLKFEKETDPEAIRSIESKRFFEKNPSKLNFEHEEVLGALFDLLKQGIVKLRVKHKKENNSWKAEIYFIDTDGIWYSTDLPDEVKNLMNVVISNGYEPEYIEE